MDTKTNRVLVIKSSEWLRIGEEILPHLRREHRVLAEVDSCLYDRDRGPHGMSCCIGLDGRSFGIPLDELDLKSFPSVLSNAGKYKVPVEYLDRWVCFTDGLYAKNNFLAEQASAINDNRRLTDEQKIARLRPIFAQLNTEIDWRPNE